MPRVCFVVMANGHWTGALSCNWFGSGLHRPTGLKVRTKTVTFSSRQHNCNMSVGCHHEAHHRHGQHVIPEQMQLDFMFTTEIKTKS